MSFSKLDGNLVLLRTEWQLAIYVTGTSASCVFKAVSNAA